MSHRAASQIIAVPTRHRGRRRPLSPFGLIPEERTAAAMADQQSADDLMTDLLALVDTGLIAPVHEHGTVRYALTDPDNAGHAT